MEGRTKRVWGVLNRFGDVAVVVGSAGIGLVGAVYVLVAMGAEVSGQAPQRLASQGILLLGLAAANFWLGRRWGVIEFRGWLRLLPTASVVACGMAFVWALGVNRLVAVVGTFSTLGATYRFLVHLARRSEPTVPPATPQAGTPEAQPTGSRA